MKGGGEKEAKQAWKYRYVDEEIHFIDTSASSRFVVTSLEEACR
jgi:hypothetical protein